MNFQKSSWKSWLCGTNTTAIYIFQTYAVNDIRICDDELAEALKHLSERNRENLLMYYFLEIERLPKLQKDKTFQEVVFFKNRHNSLELMKKILKEKR